VRVVIVNAFERGNRGDAALLSAMIEQVREAYPTAETGICGFEEPHTLPEFDGVPNLGSIRRYAGDESVGPLRRHSRKFVALFLIAALSLGLGKVLLRAADLLLPAEPAAEFKALANADVVISLGGGYLRGAKDLPSDVSVAFLLLPLWIAQRFKVPVVSAPQSYGPFPSRFQSAAVRRVLSRNVVVSAREDISVQLLADTGIPDRIVRRDVDSAFAFTGGSHRDWRAELGIPEQDRMVLVTARQYLPAVQQAAYEQAVAELIAHVLEDDGAHVVLAPQVTCAYHADDDRIVQRRIEAIGPHPRLRSVEDDTISHHDIMALYGAANHMIGTRFHSVIFSLLARIPCIAISYERKGRGIMRDLDLERWVIDMPETTGDRLIASYDELRADHAYGDRLESVIPAYRDRAHEFVDVLRAVGEGQWPLSQPQAEISSLSASKAGR
jgi:colanic acid/amylovoran biosynthesis protein